MYEVITDGDESGIWLGDVQIASAWSLSQHDLTASQVCKWSQKAISTLIRRERKEKGLKP